MHRVHRNDDATARGFRRISNARGWLFAIPGDVGETSAGAARSPDSAARFQRDDDAIATTMGPSGVRSGRKTTLALEGWLAVIQTRGIRGQSDSGEVTDR